MHDSPGRADRQVDGYFGLLTLTYGVASTLAALPIQFFLKDRLHLGPQAVALFTLLVGLPGFVTFLFGYLRDRWRPRGWGDRGYLLGASVLAVAANLSLMAGRITYVRLLIMILALNVLYQMLNAVIQALSTAVAQRRGMTGRLSAVYWLGVNLPLVITSLAGGWLAAHLPPQQTFLVVAGVVTLLGAQAFWRPAAVFAGDVEVVPRRHDTWRDVLLLLRHRPLWPAVLVSGMWNFALFGGPVLLYYLTAHVHMTSPQYGVFAAIQSAAFLPTTALYGLVCRRFSLRRLLWVATALAVLQAPPLLFLRTPWEAYVAAAAVGLFGGFANGAYWDLLMRAAPRGLEGTAVTLGGVASYGVGQVSNLMGASLYAHGGFVAGIWLTTLVYALIAPVLLLVPRAVTARHDAEGDVALVSASAAP